MAKGRKHIALALLIMAVLFVSAAIVAHNSQKRTGEEYFPTDGWRTSTPEAQGMDSAELNKMFKRIIDGKLPIDSLLIVRNGYLVAEKYFHGQNKNTLHELQSATKSFTSALVGIAVKEGSIKSLDDKVLDYFPGISAKNIDARKKAITLRHLLTMTAGLSWDGFYSGTYDTNSELYFSADPARYVLDRPMAENPGQRFLYNNGASQLLSEIVSKASSSSSSSASASATDPKAFVEEKLFKPLGITQYSWEKSADGTLLGYSGLYLTARDMAKFGYLYLKKGEWQGKQVIDQKWVQDSSKIQAEEYNFNSIGYGYQWWINSFGGYSARGLHGQYIFVMPDTNMVVVFQSSFTDESELLPMQYMIGWILPAVKSKQP